MAHDESICGAGVDMSKVHHELKDHSRPVEQMHTAIHLLYEGVRKVLPGQIVQCGAEVFADRAQLDISYRQAATDEQRQALEDFVNAEIAADIPVQMEQLEADDAEKLGLLTAESAKGYRERQQKVKVCSIGDESTGYVSRKICIGFHAERTGEVGRIRIAEEKESPSGVRRIIIERVKG
jgi:alanyl-tRNA synthetase